MAVAEDDAANADADELPGEPVPLDEAGGARAQPASPATVDWTPCGHEASRSAQREHMVKLSPPTVRAQPRGACTAVWHVAAEAPLARIIQAWAHERNWLEPTDGSLQQKPRDAHSAAHHACAEDAVGGDGSGDGSGGGGGNGGVTAAS